MPQQFDCYGPARLGDIFWAASVGYQTILIVDGAYGCEPSVWHKEILGALYMGARVVGAGSLGALRAAELSIYGMIGVGKVYRLYRSGAVNDDDEVALIHAVAELGYQPLSVPMINARFTFRALRQQCLIRRSEEMEALGALKNKHFSERNFNLLDSQKFGEIKTLAESRYVNQKQVDALEALSFVVSGDGELQAQAWTEFNWMSSWLAHFERALGSDYEPPVKRAETDA